MSFPKSVRFAACFALTCLGCLALLRGWLPVFATVCFGLAPVFLYRGSDWSRPRFHRELWGLAATVAGIAALMMAARFFPRPFGEQWVRHPIVVGVFWVVVCTLLAWRWRRENAQAGALDEPRRS